MSDDSPRPTRRLPLHWLFAIGLPASWLAGPLGVDALWFLAGPANLLHVGVALGAVLGIDALRQGRRWLGWTLLLNPIVLGAWWAPRILAPQGLKAAPLGASADLQVVAWNLGSAVASPDDAASWIAEQDADVVALCELNAQVAAELVARLSERYPYRVLHPLGVPGRGVLSRFPIVETEFFHLEGERAHLDVTLDVNGRPLRLTVVHLSLFAALLGRADGSVRDLGPLTDGLLASPPGLLLGDFNSSETSAVYARLAASGLVNTFREAGEGLGFSFPLPGRYKGLPLPPIVRIDHVWRTPGLVARRAKVGSDGGADHLPLIVDLDFVD
ncbi:endonuclease/exonuclease/phosphatase family protein [Engelhardtia mirabilis]|uniref:Endonuclease/Exonuclease/phosphatase family protein n=1 Tax=Engelhardtia mirabilis TaxID=2528011 RepID=A0A518BNQ7_9BACT|nr:Endonuclease/Exonuclease/phosphatase family protein [Planctomycetes bacterium Pla133]QDV02942.1 Endonuclease/Exonuclease/phosphatase family protein [Planctomycetes bacterium Pla86]